jgi:hypothetical protein
MWQIFFPFNLTVQNMSFRLLSSVLIYIATPNLPQSLPCSHGAHHPSLFYLSHFMTSTTDVILCTVDCRHLKCHSLELFSS